MTSLGRTKDSGQQFFTDVSEVDEAVLADVGAGAGLRGDDGATPPALLVADDAELGGLDAAGQVHVEDGAQLLQQLHTQEVFSSQALLSAPPPVWWGSVKTGAAAVQELTWV